MADKHMTLHPRHQRLIAAAVSGIIAGVVSGAAQQVNAALMWVIGWNVCAVLYLLLTLHAVRPHHSRPVKRTQLKQQANQQNSQQVNEEDIGVAGIVLVVLLATASSALAIYLLLSGASGTRGSGIFSAALTSVNSWCFVHACFAVHYASVYFSVEPKVLDFPGEEPPQFSDFFYFAFVIGATAQTADVAITSRSLRKLVLLHSMVAWLFNATIVGLMINVIATMMQ